MDPSLGLGNLSPTTAPSMSPPRSRIVGIASARARTCLEDVGPGASMHTRYESLSGGIQRRLAPDQTLVSEPAVVLLDEPTTGWTPSNDPTWSS